MAERLVLLHGALASGAQVAPLARRLAGRYDVVTPDLDGHGSRPPARLRLDDFVTTALDAAGPGPAVLAGYSLGGYVALLAALRSPDRVARVMTVATKLAWTPEVAAAECAKLDPDRIAEKVPRFAAALEAAHPGPGWRNVLAGTAELLRGLGADPALTGAGLAEIGVPVRVVVGDRDELVTLEECVAARRALPRGELAVLPGTGHPFERMDPGTLAALVSD